MKDLWLVIKKNMVWMLLTFALDVMFMFFLWLMAPEDFGSIALTAVLLSVFLFAVTCIFMYIRERKQAEAFVRFVEQPDEQNEEALLSACSEKDREQVRVLAETLHEMGNRASEAENQAKDYQEYVELWAHEIKTPLSLLTFVVDNRRDELPKNVVAKLDSVSGQMQNYVNQMLYYSRIKSSVKDYRMEEIDVEEFVGEVLMDFRPLLEEKGIRIRKNLEPGSVYCDRRGLQFILGLKVSADSKWQKGFELRIEFPRI